jgi:FkbM family methyltransferase
MLWALRNWQECYRQLVAAIADPCGQGGLALKIQNLGVRSHHQWLFYEMPPGALCVDCGANVGKFTDIVLHQGGVSFAFEPNPMLFSLLQRKYANNDRVVLFQSAVGTDDGMALFNLPVNARENPAVLWESGTLLKKIEVNELAATSETQVVDLVKFLAQKISAASPSAPPVWLLKLDIEGGEFEVLEKLLITGTHRLARHIVVETHERFFPDGQERLERLHRIIKETDAEHVWLDWI